MGNAEGVCDSEFYMWRAIFAMAHADHVVTSEERRFMYDALNKVNFSSAQQEVLEDDIENAHDIAELFSMITDQKYRCRFFYFARMLVWCDGDFDAQEQKIFLELEKTHAETVDMDSLIGKVDMELQDNYKSWIKEDMQDSAATGHMGSFLNAFIHRFHMQ